MSRGGQPPHGRFGRAMRACERVVAPRAQRGLPRCVERCGNQHVERLHEEEAPEREPRAARALRGPGRERGAEQAQRRGPRNAGSTPE